jgi:hypothetical protein
MLRCPAIVITDTDSSAAIRDTEDTNLTGCTLQNALKLNNLIKTFYTKQAVNGEKSVNFYPKACVSNNESVPSYMCTESPYES